MTSLAVALLMPVNVFISANDIVPASLPIEVGLTKKVRV